MPAAGALKLLQWQGANTNGIAYYYGRASQPELLGHYEPMVFVYFYQQHCKPGNGHWKVSSYSIFGYLSPVLCKDFGRVWGLSVALPSAPTWGTPQLIQTAGKSLVVFLASLLDVRYVHGLATLPKDGNFLYLCGVLISLIVGHKYTQ